MNEYGVFAKEVAIKLEITASTLRQWSLALEKEGYEFQRNEKDQRIYYDRDISSLFELKKLIEKNRSRDDAIKAIAKRYTERNNAEKTLSVIGRNNDKEAFTKDDIEKMLEGKLESAIQQAFNQGKKQGREEMKEILNKIDKRIEERDQNLMQTLRSLQEVQENQLQLAAAEEEEKKKGFWSKVFGK